MISVLLNLLFPPKCHFCQRVLDRNETDLCHRCRREAPEFTRPKRNFQLIAQWTAVWYYKGNVPNSIHMFKFHNARNYAIFFGKALALRLQDECLDQCFDALTWVPASYRRRLDRGYDQSELLARALGKELGVKPVRSLKKLRHTLPQSTIHGSAERRANVFNAYACVKGADFAGKRVLLVDDVVTTGSTASECAKMILANGATHVYLATIAAASNDKTRR